MPNLNDVCLSQLLIQQIFCLHGQVYFCLALSFDLRHQSRLSERECDLQRHQEGQEGRWCTYRCHALMKDGMLEKLFGGFDCFYLSYWRQREGLEGVCCAQP